MIDKKTQVIMLPTNEKATLVKVLDGSLALTEYLKEGVGFQHLYFLSDEEIKEGDWYIDRNGKVQQCEYVKNNILNGPNQTVKAKGVKGFDSFSSQPRNIFGESAYRTERKIKGL